MGWLTKLGPETAKTDAPARPTPDVAGGDGPRVIDAEIVEDAPGPAGEVDLGFLLELPGGDGSDRLSDDPNVRAVLAAKLARLLPQLSDGKLAQISALAVKALELLARDEMVRVREALAGAIKDVACAPPAVCRQLSEDVERSVAAPVLRYCLALSDEDLLAIIQSRPESWRLSAIAARAHLSGPLAAAIHQAGDVAATGVLLDNQGAEIPDPTLEAIVEEAIGVPDWHAKLAARPLSGPLALRLAAFVDRSVLETLRRRCDLDPVTVRDVVMVARRRVKWLDDNREGETAAARARRLFLARQLDDEAVSDALSWHQDDFVKAALAYLARVPLEVVEAILDTKSPRSVTALAWRAGLKMRTAIQLQVRLAKIDPRKVLNARDGADYPMTPTEVAWQLELHGIEIADDP